MSTDPTREPTGPTGRASLAWPEPRYWHGGFGRASWVLMSGPTAIHAHPHAQIVFNVCEETALCLLEDETLSLPPGTAVFLPAYCPHHCSPVAGAQASLFMLNLETNWLRNAQPFIFEAAKGGKARTILFAITPRMAGLIRGSFTGGRNPVDGDEPFHDLSVGILLDYVATAADDSASKVHPRKTAAADFRIRKAMQIMRAFPKTSLDVSSLARACGLSRPHFHKQFVEVAGVSPRLFLNSLLMDAIIERMRDRSLSLARIAEEFEFSAPGNFTRFFARHTGLSPASYRASMMN